MVRVQSLCMVEQGNNFIHGNADWKIIKEVKDAVKIPVIGNGDVVDGESARKMFETTNCDGIMIGRASNGNPWIFDEVISFLETGITPNRPTLEEIKCTILRHLDMLVSFKGEYTAVREMRKHISWYIKGMPNSAIVRNEINQIDDLQELRERIQSL